MARFLSDEETFEILKKYDPDYHDYIVKNAWNFGIGTKMYAQHLKAQHEQGQDGGDSHAVHETH